MLIEIDPDTLSTIVKNELLDTLDYPEGFTKKELKAVKKVVLGYMLPDEIMERFGKKTYNKFYGVGDV